MTSLCILLGGSRKRPQGANRDSHESAFIFPPRSGSAFNMRIHEGKFEENKKNSRYAVLDSEPAVKQLEQKEQSDLQK